MAKAVKRGKLIVIDGADGVGKATQVVLLMKRLQKEKRQARVIDFPRYEHNFFGKLIGKCLAGEYGDFISIDPHIASVLFAADRFESKCELENWLSQGYVVVCDRYVSANQMHQGGKIQNDKKRKEFLRELDEMEFKIFHLPRPDLIIYLDVPLKISNALLNKKKQGISINHSAKGKKDLAELNQKYLENSRRGAMKLVKENNNWIRIECTKKGQLLSREIIVDMIWQKVEKVIK